MKTATKNAGSKRPARSTQTGHNSAIKGFDSAKTMRAIRDKMSKEIMNMTFEEEKAYLERLLST